MRRTRIKKTVRKMKNRKSRKNNNVKKQQTMNAAIRGRDATNASAIAFAAERSIARARGFY